MSETATAATITAPDQEESWVYFEGGIRRYRDAKLGLMTHALHYGTGCFEGLRGYWSEELGQLFTFRQPEHYRRLRDSAKILEMELPHSIDELCSITDELLRRNGYRQDVYVRPLCYKASEENYEEVAVKNAKFRKVWEPWKKFRAEQVQWFSIAEGRFDSFMVGTQRSAQKGQKKG